MYASLFLAETESARVEQSCCRRTRWLAMRPEGHERSAVISRSVQVYSAGKDDDLVCLLLSTLIVVCAGLTFAIDIELAVGNVYETVTVSGESPMLETSKPTSVLNIDGELLRAAPVTSRRLFSDVLDLAPGVGSRNVDDGVGRRAYYFHGSHIYAHAFLLEGAPASADIDAAAHSMGMGGDVVQDAEVKLGGNDASSPASTGVVMNVVTPSGGNRLKGLLSYTFQPLDWNSDNTKGGVAPGGLPTYQAVNQSDVS